MFDSVDRSAFLGFYITFIVLAAIANVLVVAAIVRLFITQPIMRTSAKHVAVVFCCLTCLLTAVFPEAIIANYHLNRKLNSLERFFTCGESLMVEVSTYLLATLAHLLVAVVIMAEALRIQQWVKLGRKAQLVVTMVLCLMAVEYVAVVVTTVFYKVRLADSKNPCHEYGFSNV
nr:hypothetical protein BaRGS_029374 [Batillaria attramentaria]